MDLKNWKTTLAGIIGGVVAYTVTMVQTGDPWDWKAWAMGLAPVIIGYLAKDKDVTGGVREQ